MTTRDYYLANDAASRLPKFFFVGERRSPTAKRKNWSWEDRRLAAKQLFDALEAINIVPKTCLFGNAFEGDGIERAALHAKRGWTIVGMGLKAQRRLTEAGIPHLALIHPAARGRIRKKQRYVAHVKSVLVRP